MTLTEELEEKLEDFKKSFANNEKWIKEKNQEYEQSKKKLEERIKEYEEIILKSKRILI